MAEPNNLRKQSQLSVFEHAAQPRGDQHADLSATGMQGPGRIVAPKAVVPLGVVGVVVTTNPAPKYVSAHLIGTKTPLVPVIEFMARLDPPPMDLPGGLVIPQHYIRHIDDAT